MTRCAARRGVYDAGKVMTAAMDYTPYGTPRAWRGDVPESDVAV